MRIGILRLFHHLPRDERISTHAALVARAFGATPIVYSLFIGERMTVVSNRVFRASPIAGQDCWIALSDRIAEQVDRPEKYFGNAPAIIPSRSQAGV